MEKILYLLIILSGIRIVFFYAIELYGAYKVYAEFTRNGFCPSEMNMECTCEKCQAIADSMTEEEKLSDKKDHYHYIKDKLKGEVIDQLSCTIFFSALIILSVIKYFKPN